MALKTLIVENMGLKGLNSDQAPWSLPPEFLTFGVNFRITSNSIVSSGGYEPWSVAPIEFNPGYLMHVLSTSSNYWLVAGRSDVNSFDGVNWSSIGTDYPGIGVNDELLWSGCMLGKIAFVNNPQHYPEYWWPVSPGQKLQALDFLPGSSWANESKSCNVMRSHQNFLFALGMNEGGLEIPGSYRWSHPADINGLPYTWDETDPSSLAGKAQLGGDGGDIIDGMSLRDSFVIYSETAINLLTFTGDEFVFRRKELSSTYGLLSAKCIVEVKGKHYFIGDGDIYVNDGNSIQSILHNRLRKAFTAKLNADQYGRSFAVRNKALSEIWFCVPEEDADYPNVAYIYNWRDDSWAVRLLPAFDAQGLGDQIVFANYGAQATPTVSWDDWQGTWDEQLLVWGSRARTPLDDTIVACTTDSQLLILDPNELVTGNAGTRIERTNFALEGQGVVTSINKVIPHISGTEAVEISFGSQDFAGGPVRWGNTVIFKPEEDRHVDIRTTGELHAFRIDSTGKGNWSLSGMDIIYSINGSR